MGFIATIVIGLLAGWIAGMIMKGGGGGYGLWGDLGLGVVGSIVGGWLGSLLTGFNLTTLVVSVIGAVIVIAIYRLITRRSLTR